MLVQSPQAPAMLAATQWNDRHCIGTPVIVRVDGVDIRCRTSSAAWTFNSRALVSCRGLSTAIDLRHVTPRFQCWIRVHRRGHKNHWLHTVWDEEAECRRACEQVCKDDLRIESYEIRHDEPTDLTD